MTKHHDSIYALHPKTGGSYGIRVTKTENGHEINGLVSTPHCYVKVLSFNYPQWKISRLILIKNGKQYERRFKKAYTARGLVTKAKQFANEVFNNGN